MITDELAAIKAAPADVTFRDVQALVAEIEQLRATLQEIRDYWPGNQPDDLDFRVLQRMAERALTN